jgi:hypothetical protein
MRSLHKRKEWLRICGAVTAPAGPPLQPHACSHARITLAQPAVACEVPEQGHKPMSPAATIIIRAVPSCVRTESVRHPCCCLLHSHTLRMRLGIGMAASWPGPYEHMRHQEHRLHQLGWLLSEGAGDGAGSLGAGAGSLGAGATMGKGHEKEPQLRVGG